jgi:hypothetical protein
MIIYRIVLLSFLSVPAWAQIDKDLSELSAEEKRILHSIGSYHIVKTDTTGKLHLFWPKEDSLWASSERMSTEKLLELTHHEKPIIRCRAFGALVDIDISNTLSIIEEHLYDTAWVHSSPGSCLDTKQRAGDYFVEVYQRKCRLMKNPIQNSKLDSLLIFQPNNLWSRYMAMHRAARAGKYYDRIREIVLEGDFRETGLTVLAKFRKEQDIDVILNWNVVKAANKEKANTYTFYAISIFPHPAFSSFLRQNMRKAILTKPDMSCRGLYLAVANYNNKTSHDLLLLPFQITDKSIRGEHLQTLSSVLKENSDPIYNDLRVRLKAYQ